MDPKSSELSSKYGTCNNEGHILVLAFWQTSLNPLKGYFFARKRWLAKMRRATMKVQARTAYLDDSSRS